MRERLNKIFAELSIVVHKSPVVHKSSPVFNWDQIDDEITATLDRVYQENQPLIHQEMEQSQEQSKSKPTSDRWCC